MLKKSAFPHAMNFIVTLIMIIIMAASMSLINSGHIFIFSLIKEIIIGTLIGFALLEILPIGKLSDKFATKVCKQNRGSGKYILADNLIRTIFMTLVMNTLFTFMAIGIVPYYFNAWLGGILPGFIIGYIAGLLAGAIGEKLCTKLCSRA